MTKNITLFLCIFLITFPSAFGEEEKFFKKNLEEAMTDALFDADELEESIPTQKKALDELAGALATPTPAKVRQAYEKAWRAEMETGTQVGTCRRGAEHLRKATATAVEFKEIGKDEVEESAELSNRLEQLAQAGDQSDLFKRLKSKAFSYAFSESDNVMSELKEAVANRTKAAERLSKVIGGDPVKVRAFTTQVEKAHQEVVAAWRRERDIARLLRFVEQEFEYGRVGERQYDKYKKIATQFERVEKAVWPTKEELATYQQVAGPQAAVNLILSTRDN